MDSWDSHLAEFVGALAGQFLKGLAWGFGFSLSAAVVYFWLVAK